MYLMQKKGNSHFSRMERKMDFEILYPDILIDYYDLSTISVKP